MKSVMYLFLFVSTISLVLCYGFDNFDYHDEVGIPRAKEIKEYEDSLGDDERIVGGKPAEVGWFPYQAGLIIYITEEKRSSCGGSLIQRDRVLTAGHCWHSRNYHVKYVEVVLASNQLFSGGIRVKSTKVEAHKDWLSGADRWSDIAMIYLPTPVGLNENIKLIKLPLDLTNELFVGWDAIISGYGKSSPEPSESRQLNFVKVKVMTNKDCGPYFHAHLSDKTLCSSGAGNVGGCHGDSGGPLAVKHRGDDVLIGIAKSVTERGCFVGDPTAHVRVTTYLPWIKERLH